MGYTGFAGFEGLLPAYGCGDAAFTAQRAKLARYLAKLASMPVRHDGPPRLHVPDCLRTPIPGWPPTSRASTVGLPSTNFGISPRRHTRLPPCGSSRERAELNFLDDAFTKLRSQVEITKTESELA